MNNKQLEILEKCYDLLDRHHGGCDQSTCSISVAMSHGYDAWAVHLWSSSGASCSVFDELYVKLDKTFDIEAEKQRKEMVETISHTDCPHCNAVIWEYEYVTNSENTYCSSCGEEHQVMSQNETA